MLVQYQPLVRLGRRIVSESTHGSQDAHRDLTMALDGLSSDRGRSVKALGGKHQLGRPLRNEREFRPFLKRVPSHTKSPHLE